MKHVVYHWTAVRKVEVSDDCPTDSTDAFLLWKAENFPSVVVLKEDTHSFEIVQVEEIDEEDEEEED